MPITNSEKRARYYRKNPDKHRDSQSKYRQKRREAVILLLGGKCIKCGFDDHRALQIDHINGGGQKELALLSGANYINTVMKSIANEEEKYQLLCANCNWIKRWENKEAKGKPRVV